MRCAGALLGLALIPSHAQAQNTAEVAITLQDRTIFLSADNSASALPMVTRDGDALHLTFAQLHLGFPLPRVLTLTLREQAGAWHVDAVSLDGPTIAIATAPPGFFVSAGEEGLTFSLIGEALYPSPLGVVLQSLDIEVTLPAD